MDQQYQTHCKIFLEGNQNEEEIARIKGKKRTGKRGKVQDKKDKEVRRKSRRYQALTCTSPIVLVDKDLVVPCGRCNACLIRRSAEWATRILHETSYHNRSCFITLTYDKENLPEGENLVMEHLQKFVKRLRKKKDSIKYFACGEYGEKRGRPHYHVILMGVGIKERALLEKKWKFGQIHIGEVSYNSARYTADYVLKASRENIDGRRKPFIVMSKGIGKEFIIENGDTVRETLTLTLGGRNVGVPKYYLDKLAIPKEQIIKMALENKMKIQERRMNQHQDVIQAEINHRIAMRRLLESRKQMKNDRGGDSIKKL